MDNVETGGVILIQVAHVSGAVSPQSNSEAFTAATEKRLDEVASLIRNSCSKMATGLLGMASSPAEIQMEFGVDVGGEAGVPFVTKGTINANFKVSVTWRNTPLTGA